MLRTQQNLETPTICCLKCLIFKQKLDKQRIGKIGFTAREKKKKVEIDSKWIQVLNLAKTSKHLL